ncbi:MAG: tetratricopeptide repeat protein [Calditrichaeota bacterium]|nr:tetratricopeptide repeat protein [Calditrichota bacterium]
MSQIYEIKPNIKPERAKLLKELTEKLNEALEPKRTDSEEEKFVKPEDLIEIGSLLWEASGLDENELLRTIEDARDSSVPVRIIITGNKHQHLPWELLYCDNPLLGFLTRQPWIVLARRVSGKGKQQPQHLGRPLRLLLFISSPEGIDPEKMRLDYEKEEEALFTALDDPWSKGEIDIDIAEDGCLSTLKEKLKEKQYHAVILSMHGGMTKSKAGDDEYGLLFEDEDDWHESNVAGSDLASMLENLPAGHIPGLIVLSACRSALIEPDVGKAINSVAFELHKKGCERVLGMRLSVKDIFASAFTAELFQLLARGTDTLGRAVTQARIEAQRGKWLPMETPIGKGKELTDIFGQWTLPVLLDRTADGPLIDKNEKLVDKGERVELDDTIPGDQKIAIVSRANFIGRRRVIRRHLKPFLDGRDRCLMFTGPGGVGKSTTAGFFVRRFLDKHSDAWLLGFEAPFNLSSIETNLTNTIENNKFLSSEYAAERQKPGFTDDLDSKLKLFAKEGRHCCFVLDNLESIQDDKTLELDPDDEESAWFLKTVCNLQDHAHVILTGRYTIKGISELQLTHCELHDAPYSDILHRLRRLKVSGMLDSEQKLWMYKTLGGNHRAIEWTACLLAEKDVDSDQLRKAIEDTSVPTNTPKGAVEAVLAGMRQNLLLSTLRKNLTPEQDRLLRAACLYRVPVNYDGLHLLDMDSVDHDANRQRLLDYKVILTSYDERIDMNHFFVPPIVRELLKGDVFDETEFKVLNTVAGKYHKFQGEHVSRYYYDYIEAIFHFRLAGGHESADALAKNVAGFYYNRSYFKMVNEMCEEIVNRKAPPPPWWALNRYGLCQLTMGNPQEALKTFERALPLSLTKEDRSTTLHNIGYIHKASGEYDKSLELYKQSLKINQEIGDRKGEGATLNNIGEIHRARGEYDDALKLYQQNIIIFREIGDRMYESGTLNNISLIYQARGEWDKALACSAKALKIMQEIGDRRGENATLNNIGEIHRVRGEYAEALKFFQQSLKIGQEIGDRAGMIPTLHNMALIAEQNNDMKSAIKMWYEALNIALEINDAQGIFLVASALGVRAAYMGAKEQAKQLLTMALTAGRRAGFPGTGEIEEELRKLE